MLLLQLFLLKSSRVYSLDNGVARTPPMGWMSWERYRCEVDCVTYPNDCINEKLYTDMADRIKADGWLAAGYEYVNVDDCWSNKQRNKDGTLDADPARFPSGMGGLADYMHKKGLKFGLYTDAGTHTCGGYPGSQNYMTIDARTYAEWGVDSIKVDGCYVSDPRQYKPLYTNFSLALNQTGRPMVYWCSWPAYVGNTAPYQYIASICNGWRPYGDIQDSWNSLTSIINWWAANQPLLQPAAAPGAWNDPDMLILGDFALSIDQARVQMAIWAIIAAPLLMSNDLRNIAPEYVKILQNREIIAVNQDKAGMQGGLVATSGSVQWWLRNLANGYTALAMWSSATGGSIIKVSTSFSALGDTTGCGSAVAVRDLFTQKNMGVFSGSFQTTVNPNGAQMYMLNCTIKPYAPIPPQAGALIENDPCGYAYQNYQLWSYDFNGESAAGVLALQWNKSLCLTAQGTDTALVAPCVVGLSSQQWTFAYAAGSTANFNIVSGNGRCLDIYMSDSSPGTQIGLYGCGTEQTNQLFKYGSTPGSLQSLLNSFCLSVSAGPPAKHTGVSATGPATQSPKEEDVQGGLAPAQPRSQPRAPTTAKVFIKQGEMEL
eukprot:gb/GEZN01003747.1/.p1 GENE.gb/GEZN01003747.1/~~gb/GEZN01003747.1/.p1  ORF type:complete len:601 (-),score=71.39 gb/GEZN01003747.1/:256-2058(-)